MKMKKKGKVHPSPPPPSTQQQPQSSSQYLNEDESLSVLRLLPATILVLVSVLSVEEREVLAYLITRGTTICSAESKKKTKKKKKSHKPPVFDCECFDCYTSYWFRWDSSPNRELIHQIIDAFENHHLSSSAGDSSASSKNNNKSKRVKKREKPPRPLGDKDEKAVVEVETTVLESHVSSSPHNSPGRLSEAEVAEREPQVEEEEKEEVVQEETTVSFPATGHKGLARKVLPDVLGLFNSNFWRLWNPNA